MKMMKYIQIKNRGSPISSVINKFLLKMEYYIPHFKIGGLLYNLQLNLIKGLYRKLNNR